MIVTITHCGDSYEGTWRHNLWRVTLTEDTEHVRRTEQKYFKSKAEAREYANQHEHQNQTVLH